MKTKLVFLALVSAFSLQPSALLGQGSLTPPGAPAPTMKTLDQVEPRTPVNAQNTPGDANALFKITQPGSYYLTGNVTGVSNKHGIVIACTNVTLDLMGFDLDGGGIESRSAVKVSGAQRHIVVANGTIHHWGEGGVSAGAAEQCLIQGVRVANTGGPNGDMIAGIQTGNASTVSRCVVQWSGWGGFRLGAGCVVSDCTALMNYGGFEVGAGGTVSRCTARANMGIGVSAANDSTAIGCTATSNSNSGIVISSGVARDCSSARNGLRGFDLGGGSTVTGCSANYNTSDGFYFSSTGCVISGCSAMANGGDGILIGSSSLVSGNTCYLNAGAGINTQNPDGTGNRIEGNLVTANARGIDCNPATDNVIVRNVARSNTNNFDVVANNFLGTVVTSAAAMNSTTNTCNINMSF